MKTTTKVNEKIISGESFFSRGKKVIFREERREKRKEKAEVEKRRSRGVKRRRFYLSGYREGGSDRIGSDRIGLDILQFDRRKYECRSLRKIGMNDKQGGNQTKIKRVYVCADARGL